MKVSGIVCEYNPFHNGHMHHIEQTRKNGATHIIGVMSGNFVQRGDVAVMNKFERAKLAVKCGVDLVIEIPVAHCLSSAEYYARAAVYLLKSVGCVAEISFGTENGDLPLIFAAVQASLDFSNSPQLRELLENGMSYPSAMQQLVEGKYGKHVAEVFEGSNNLLAIEYMKAIAEYKVPLMPYTIPRRSALHDSDVSVGSFASASFIRKCISEGSDFSHLVPEATMQFMIDNLKAGQFARVELLDRIMLYKLRTTTLEELAALPDVGQGLENRIYDARTSCSMEELFHSIKTKRYTMSRIRRILFCMLLGIKATDLKTQPPYGRILATNERGCEILSEAKGNATIPFATSLTKLSTISSDAKRFAELEAHSTDIYSLATKKVQPCGADYRAKIGISE